jgi:hypothetical protein
MQNIDAISRHEKGELLWERIKATLLAAEHYSRKDVLDESCQVPFKNGVYAWYFKNIPFKVPTVGCQTKEGKMLLYIGISPSKDGKSDSPQNLRKRIRSHFKGNASVSTLRKSLGVLLGLKLVCHGKRKTFTREDEVRLNEWMDDNAYVAWVEAEHPWEHEIALIENLCPPLNIKDNHNNSFAKELKQLRKCYPLTSLS